MKLKETIAITIGALAFLLITGVAKANPILDWFNAEKTKTIEFQKKSWQSAKEQNAKTKETIVNLFTKVKQNVTQD
jgi:hypothetical protein|tara:strand:+ start:679 stop:906 length:228 start_codon:yes stop_codon:yes gene_type:complete